ncbi:MAG TPA: DUF2510 domain-containing protein [Microlunatus sp.]
MAEPGWYPDPSSSPGRFRYWDGERWAAESVSDPRRRRRIIVVASILVLAVVIMVAIVIKFGPAPQTPGAATGPVTSSPTAESSAASSASSATSPTDGASAPSPSSGKSPTGRPPVTHCPDAEPTRSTQHPDDGQVHGGAISFDRVSGQGFSKPAALDHFSWWYDEHGQRAKLTDDDSGSSWQQWIAAGTVAIQPGFQTPQQATRMSMKCALSSGDYRGYTGSKNVTDQAVTIDGQEGWKMITEVSVDGRSVSGDQITLIVMNAGPPGSYSIFIGTAPLGDAARTKIISNAVDGLQVDG